MSADEIIQKHRQRLEEHKQFLGQKREARNSGGGAQLSARSTGSRDDPTSAREYTDRNSRRFETVYYSEQEDHDDHQDTGRGGYHDAMGSPRSQSKLTDGEGLGSYYTDDPTRVFEDNYRWQQKRERSLAEQKKERSMQELEGCTFKPQTNHLMTREQRQSLSEERDREPMYGPSADTSVTNHVLRQRQARHNKEESQLRANGNVDVRNWESRTTKPVEFNLGRKGDGISSLRKPIAWQSGGNQQQQQRGTRRSAEGNVGEKQQSRSIQPQDDEAHEEMDHNRKRVQLYRDQRNRANENQQQHQEEVEDPHNGRQQSHGGAMPPLEVVEAMDQTISNQEIEIARLKGIIQAQRRELDVAKAKVRQMALSSQQAQAL